MEPEEWKGLLASSLIFETKMRTLVPHLLVRLFAPFIAGFAVGIPLAFGLISAFPNVPSAGEIGFLGGFASAALLAFVVDTHYSAPKMKQAVLVADREAATLVGRQNFLEVLNKINAMDLKDIEWLKRGGRRAGWTGRPSVMERIENLRALPLGS